ncbi:stage II sporulation protein M [Jiella endophytica]|uniref:Stage II sporulation protein M n=1 Tax=Jiella endophytica TaxID=2558362 RepID=A0A4Y8RRM1_9HYPH|nr:stage II sporulation protein M [Jiella endophytica]TFF25347.1 stage II sporulation protein M [Jiella endophytica]
MNARTIRSTRFRDEREADWQRLAAIVEAAEKRGLSRLGFDDARDLVLLYRQATNSLSVAREISLDSAVVRYLESLCARAYLVVYAPRENLSGLLARFFSRSAPQAVRRSFVPILVAFLLMAVGALAAYLLTDEDPNWFYAFVPGDLASGRGPGASAESLRQVIEGSDYQPLGELGAFATYLFSHNTRVALFAFALGIVFCVPSVILLLYNGAMLGSFVSVHVDKGLGVDFMGWLTIHGVTELSAIAIASAGGLTLGYAMLFPGLRSRSAALRHAGRDAVKLAVVAAVMLVAAGLLEGIGRQLVTNFWARMAIGWGMGLLWLAWFTLAGRDGSPTREPAAEPV